MRTTIELPDNLYRSLKARAALSGMSLRALLMRLIEEGLRSEPKPPPRSAAREAPPVIIAARGIPIPAISRQELNRIEDSDDERKHG